MVAAHLGESQDAADLFHRCAETAREGTMPSICCTHGPDHCPSAFCHECRQLVKQHVASIYGRTPQENFSWLTRLHVRQCLEVP
ncbi:hypothetical protein, partial [Streptomyces katsurahamanus]|uniref:hypothetical protein n=1 Tax=Streptomyces katsurahamanus TaxID=2577098 RepID=UPI001E64D119